MNEQPATSNHAAWQSITVYLTSQQIHCNLPSSDRNIQPIDKYKRLNPFMGLTKCWNTLSKCES
ncbi:hypothetical protein E2C01_050803 [Portunus trituberculatus]|uniref:Uncharacterized protein n=1 Tax=Portunus trituberculatus TaxID=210409 RepID=A0A5B7GII2_PORTR|nr:hypothetical protein [Portunus trituberculatus]